MKNCVRCGLPLSKDNKGSMHYKPDECIRLLQDELNKEKANTDHIMGLLHGLATMKIDYGAYKK